MTVWEGPPKQELGGLGPGLGARAQRMASLARARAAAAASRASTPLLPSSPSPFFFSFVFLLSDVESWGSSATLMQECFPVVRGFWRRAQGIRPCAIPTSRLSGARAIRARKRDHVLRRKVTGGKNEGRLGLRDSGKMMCTISKI